MTDTGTSYISKTWWRLTIAVRRQGAIGAFYNRTYVVRADNKETAIHWALDDAHADGFETAQVCSITGPTEEHSARSCS